jgi:MFS family permease
LGHILDLLRHERVARSYFAVLGQSALGTGAGYVALLIVAYDRFASGWAISLVLLADLLPAMLFGPLLGAAGDHWPRRRCMVIGDAVRAAAFLGIALVDGFAATLLFALLAGSGTALFTPAALASLPGLAGTERLPAATALYGAIADLGFILGPALAAVILLVGAPELILFANAATFALSALVLQRLPFGAAPVGPDLGEQDVGLLREARDGLRALVQMTNLRTVVLAAGAILLFAGLFNVAELPFATQELDAPKSIFGVLAAVYGLGFVMGSLSGSRGGEPDVLKRRFLGGLGLVGAGFLACGVAPTLAVALPAFALAGIGNGLALVHERLLIQTTVADSLRARIFGTRDGLNAWTFAIAFIVAGALIEGLGIRVVVQIAGVGGLLIWALSTIALRRAWSPEPG